MHAAEVVALAERLPGVVLKEHRDWTSITYRGKGFAWVDHAEDTAMVKSTHPERAVLVGSDPETFTDGWESRSTAWVSIALARAGPDEVLEILADAWRLTAGKREVAAFDAAGGLLSEAEG
jgi:hypothetical protein